MIEEKQLAYLQNQGTQNCKLNRALVSVRKLIKTQVDKLANI